MRPKLRHTPPSSTDLHTAPVEPGGNLAEWRERRLLRAGVGGDLAASIASDCSMDLHAMIELVEHGCPPELAARILAPLDHERSPC
jgi:hypothetical protein